MLQCYVFNFYQGQEIVVWPASTMGSPEFIDFLLQNVSTIKHIEIAQLPGVFSHPGEPPRHQHEQAKKVQLLTISAPAGLRHWVVADDLIDRINSLIEKFDRDEIESDRYAIEAHALLHEVVCPDALHLPD